MKLSREKIVQQAARAGRRTLQLGEEAGGRIRRLSKRSWLILAGIAVLIVGGLWWWLRPEPVKPILPVVQVEPAETDDIELYGEYVGRIRAQQFVEIRARVEGFLEKMLFEEGTYVKKGQPLFIIASYESATASVAMSEADLTQAETALSYTTVSSPLSGYISERSVDIGTLVGPNGKSLLATVVKSDTVRVDFSMTGLDYLKSKARNVNLGQKDSTRKWDPYITITLADNTQYPLRGLVDFADPQVDPETGTFSVRAEMANPDRILLPGQFTKVRLLLDVREDATVVPTKSVVIEKGGAYIFVIRPDSIAERRLIELGPEVNNRVIVERGVVPGEKIVVEGFHKLTHGDKVDPVPVPEKSSATETEASEK